MIQHILFPTDGSDAARTALNYLLRFANQFNARVTLLHTYEFTMGHVLSRYSADSRAVSQLEDATRESAEKMLAELKAELEQQGLHIHGAFNEKGDAGEWIIKTAERESCDLIMMGTRGMGILKSVFLGSTSRYVVNHSHKTPVFLIPVEEN